MAFLNYVLVSDTVDPVYLLWLSTSPLCSAILLITYAGVHNITILQKISGIYGEL